MNLEFPDQIFENQHELMAFLTNIFLNPQTQAILKYVVLALAVLISLQILRSVIARSLPRRAPVPGRLGGKRAIKKEAKRAQKQGDYRQAGDLFRMISHHDQAIEMYKRAGCTREVASVYELDKKWDQACQFYEACGNLEKAAVMCQKLGDYQRAGELLSRAKRYISAAEMFERGQSFKPAAELYEKTGVLNKAAACYEKMGDTTRAAELYEQCYHQEKGKLRDLAHDTGQVNRGKANSLAREAGRLYGASGQYDKAATILTSAGFDSEAADALLRAGSYKMAAEIFYEKKMYAKASEAYELGGDTEKSCQIQGEMHWENGNQLQAAQFFERAGNLRQAAEVYEQLGNWKKAGEMYLHAGDSPRAAEVFITAGEISMAAHALEQGRQFREAAELYLKLQEPEKAIGLYSEVQDYYGAAQILQGMGRKDEAISMLQKIDSSSEEYFQASLLLGKIFVERGMLDGARERYNKVFSGNPPGPAGISHLYELALAYEKNGDYESALSVYERILAEDYSYGDVKFRADGLRRALSEVKRALGSPKPAVPHAQPPADAKSRYRILKKIGQGGMGVVYQAEDTVLHRIVAYKVLPPAVRENEKVLDNFLQEARVAASLSHTNIVTVYDTGKNETDLYITMEYVDGVTLKEQLEKQAPIPLPELLRIAIQVCLGLEYAHNRNVIHRDIKPANIMLSKDGVVKIMDFGLAKVVSESMVDKTTVKGTPMYMAPEQILGEGVDHQSDIYSLGCTLYRMASGRAPFKDGDLYYHHLHTPPQSPKEVNPALPETLERIILGCIEKDKGNRYHKIHDILEDLQNVSTPQDP